MMSIPLNEGRRYSGEIKIKRLCERLGIDMDFSLVFSGIVDSQEKNLYIISSINPSSVLKILKKVDRFKLFINEETTAYNLEAVVKDISVGKVIFQIEKSAVIKEKRRFHRFYFCCKDLGNFILQKDNKIICDDACVYELSRSGLGIINLHLNSVKVGDRIKVKNNKEQLEVDVEILHVRKRNGYEVLGGKVIKTNLNLINYIIKQYIKVSKKIIDETG